MPSSDRDRNEDGHQRHADRQHGESDSWAPRKAACSGESPRSRCRVIFSITTIASSTTNPVAMVRAINERLSRLNPMQVHHAEVAINDTGTATLGISVERKSRRNRNTTSITSPTEIISVNCTSCSDARITRAIHRHGQMSISAGICASVAAATPPYHDRRSMMLAFG